MQMQCVNQSYNEYSAYRKKSEQPEFSLSFAGNDDGQRKSIMTCIHVPTGETMKRLFDSNYSNKDANKWDFWDEIMKD